MVALFLCVGSLRSPLVPDGRGGQVLDMGASMTGPHHYFGFLDPSKHYTVESEPDCSLMVRA